MNLKKRVEGLEVKIGGKWLFYAPGGEPLTDADRHNRDYYAVRGGERIDVVYGKGADDNTIYLNKGDQALFLEKTVLIFDKAVCTVLN